MSYAHTKRRKNISKLKRQNARCLRVHGEPAMLSWRQCLINIADEVVRSQEGECIGSLQDIMEASK